jgi:hypothetical protein
MLPVWKNIVLVYWKIGGNNLFKLLKTLKIHSVYPLKHVSFAGAIIPLFYSLKPSCPKGWGFAFSQCLAAGSQPIH